MNNDPQPISPAAIAASFPDLRSVDGAHLEPGTTVGKECRMHGEFTATLNRRVFPPGATHWWSQCQKCDAYMQAEADEVHSAATARDVVSGGDSKLKHDLMVAGVPPRFMDSSINNYSDLKTPGQKTAKRRIRQWCKDMAHHIGRGSNIVMRGKFGTGKTHLAVGMIREVVSNRGTALYIKETDLVAMMQGTYGGNGTRKQVVDDMLAPDILVIDEAGRKRDTEDAKMVIADIIDARYLEKKSICIVTNSDRAAFITAIGSHAMDRIMEDCLQIGFDFASWRTVIGTDDEGDE